MIIFMTDRSIEIVKSFGSWGANPSDTGREVQGHTLERPMVYYSVVNLETVTLTFALLTTAPP